VRLRQYPGDLRQDTRVAIPDPVYPVYLDTNVMADEPVTSATGRYERILYLDSTPANAYVPAPPAQAADLVYLCFPNNPTGATATARNWPPGSSTPGAIGRSSSSTPRTRRSFRDPDLPHSIYEIEGAREVAIEIRSFSKTAGFTGTRCAYTVVPQDACSL